MSCWRPTREPAAVSWSCPTTSMRSSGFTSRAGYFKTIDRKDPFWQPRYYPFNLYSEKKAAEKLDYLHLNPVRAGLVEKAVDRAWSSARYFDSGKSVGVPLEWIFSRRSSCCYASRTHLPNKRRKSQRVLRQSVRATRVSEGIVSSCFPRLRFGLL